MRPFRGKNEKDGSWTVDGIHEEGNASSCCVRGCSREEMSETKRYASVAKDVGSDGTTYLSHTVEDTRPENVRQNEKVVRRRKSIEIDTW